MSADYDAWLCDLDGTLYKASGLKLVMAVELVLFGLPDLFKIRAFRREHERLRHQHELATTFDTTPFEEQLTRTSRELAVSPDELRAIVERWMIERPCRWLVRFRRESLVAEILGFRAAGGKTGVVSDYPARRKLEALHAAELFDVVVANGEPGGPRQLKPAPHGYLSAAAALQVEPDRCLVIGDREDADGEAAAAAGMAFRLVR